MYPQPNDFGFRKYIGFDVVGLGRLASLRMGARLTRVGPQLGSGGYGDKIPNLLLHLLSLDTAESLRSQTLASVAQATHRPIDHSGEPQAPMWSSSPPLSFPGDNFTGNGRGVKSNGGMVVAGEEWLSDVVGEVRWRLLKLDGECGARVKAWLQLEF
ncbi:hypothetical protein V6N11_080336 [Hibiscus sabdariffa]|uniref:Uncharacterized protein n=1 Tax=Hibiscus sabdariffa TaxID=183260 RepID=A0ABR2R7V0_9ROSI